MAKIQDLRNENDEIIYPITLSKAVFIDNKTRLDKKLKVGVYLSEAESDDESIDDVDGIEDDIITELDNKIKSLSKTVNNLSLIVGELQNVANNMDVHKYVCGSASGLREFLVNNARNTTFGLFTVENTADVFGEAGVMIGMYWGDGTGKFVFNVRNYTNNRVWVGSFDVDDENCWVLDNIGNKVEGNENTDLDNIYDMTDSFNNVYGD